MDIFTFTAYNSLCFMIFYDNQSEDGTLLFFIDHIKNFCNGNT